MGLPLPEGGHLTHGWAVNFFGTDYQRVVGLIAAHRRTISELECLGKRLMHAEEAEAARIGPRLDAAMKSETVIRRQAAMAPVANVGELKMKAAYFERLMNNGWCDVDEDECQSPPTRNAGPGS